MLPNNDSGDGHKKSSRQNCKSVPDDITAGEVDDDGDDLSLGSQETKSNLSKRGNGLQPKPSRKGGWGTDSSSKNKRNESEADFEDDRLRPKTQPEDDGGAESDPDVPFIPELEAELKGGRAAGGQVAMAPHVAVNRVATYKELDYELAKHSTFLTLDNAVDLKLLAKGLSSEAEVTAESDVTWEWDQLFAEVTSDLLTEWESQEQSSEKTGA